MNPGFHCQWCAQVFGHRDALRRHVRYIHRPRHFYCDICLRRFNSRAGLLRHQRTAHRQEFDGLHALIEHEREHGYRCGICWRRFRSRYALTHHLTSHLAHE